VHVVCARSTLAFIKRILELSSAEALSMTVYAGATPLHFACERADMTCDVIETLIEKCPEKLPDCRKGVRVLESVSDILDCLFLRIRESSCI
jgi:hypothetical protein